MIGYVGYTFCVCFILAATQIMNASNHTRERRMSTVKEKLNEYIKVAQKDIDEALAYKPKRVVEEKEEEEELNIPLEFMFNRTEVKLLKKSMLKALKVNQSEIMKIERRTIGHFLNKEWLDQRRYRLTDSRFGCVCLRDPKSSSIDLMKDILHNETKIVPVPANRSLTHGIAYASRAFNEFSNETGLEIKPNGLFIDLELPYLAASPDGLIGDDGIIELNCPYEIRYMSPQKAVKEHKLRYLIVNEKTNVPELYHFSTYYYQIQGQLHITRRKYCYFIVWTPKGMLYEKIYRDDNFWKEKMEKQLTSFYMDYMLPEIVDPAYLPWGTPMDEDDYDHNQEDFDAFDEFHSNYVEKQGNLKKKN